MNFFSALIIIALVVEFILSTLSNRLTLRALSPTLPTEFSDVFDVERYAQSQNYTRSRANFGLLRNAINLAAVLAVWHLGGFEWLDQGVRGFGFGAIPTGLIYFGALGLGSLLLGLPFGLYGTFVIEAKFGFNRTTFLTFITDFVKGAILTVSLGGILMTGVLFFFQWAESSAWLWCWAAATLFLLTVQFVAPTLIMPLFNKFTPLEGGSLRTSIVSYAESVAFPLRDIFVVDGSKRSSKANAFFTGFGGNKRIGLFDTLVEHYSVPELVAVVAHEVGHYKEGHLLKGLLVQILYQGMLFFLLSLVLENDLLFDAFYMTETSVYASFVFFGLLLTPVDLILSMYVNASSRKHEFEADAFASATTGHGKDLISALKKLSADSLANLTPHPLDVFLHYSHPPVTQRIAMLRQISADE